MNVRIGPQGHTVNTAVQVALVQPWLVAAAVCRVSVTAMATLFEDTVTTRQASVTAPTTLRDHTVSPACLVTMETPGTMEHVIASARAALCFSPPPPPLPCLSPPLWGGGVAQRGKEDFLIACGSCQ